MYCTKCGTPNDDNAGKCIKCQETLDHIAQARQGEPIKVRNYLVPAIVTTIFCCVPLGIVAVVYSVQANSKVSAGDIDGGIACSEKAKTWTWITFGVGLIFGALWLMAQIASLILSHKPL